MVAKYFGSIPKAEVPPVPDLTEPRQEKEKTVTHTDPLATRPALAFSYHMPPRNTPEYWAMGLIDQMLAQGDDSLLHEELVKKRGYTGDVSTGINELGNMFNYDGPMLWTVWLKHDPGVNPQDILNAADGVIERLQSQSVDRKLVDRSLTKLRSQFYNDLSRLAGFGRADMLASFALFDDNPARINTLESQLRSVTPELVQKTAREYLRTGNRTVLIWEAGAAKTAETKAGGVQ